MKPISQRTARINLIFNGILTLACIGLLVYALLQNTRAENMAMEAITFKAQAEMQRELARRKQIETDSAVMVAQREGQKN